MSCVRWQEAISAIADGEDPGVDLRLLETHLEGCAACTHYRAALDAGRSRERLAPAPTVRDVSRDVARAAAGADRAGHPAVLRGLLAVVAAVVVVVALADLVGGDHEARHVGAFGFAYGVGLFAVALRPARARTMLAVGMVVAAALALSTVVDVARGATGATGEAAHLPELASVPLLWLLARPGSSREPGAGHRRPLR